jgi:3-phenylpropionate/trans-cinnamate dioxygenase ferredoxin reductase component
MSRNGRTVDHLLVGAGVAAVSCAAELRAMGFDGSITVVGREPHPPYRRPTVDKSYLQGAETRDETLLRPTAWWEQNQVELLTGTSVTAIDPNERRARLSSGEEVCFGEALLATGATPRRLEVEGAGLEGIHSLGTLADADALRDDLADAEHVVTIGGSYVACEAAAALRTLGRRCTIVMVEEHPLQEAFGSTTGRFLRGALETHGITVLGRDAVDRYDGTSGHVRGVHTKAGVSLKADVVVVGVGVKPDATLGRNTGLRIGATGGLHCDAFLRSSHQAVFCAGDACEYDSVIHRRRLRVELQHAAAEQGSTAARNMLGEQQAHTTVPYCTAELADWVSLEYVGPAIAWDEEMVRGYVADGEFTVWYLDGGRLVGALMVGRSQDFDHACSLIASPAELGDHRAALSDPDSDLAAVTGSRV